MSPEQIKSLIQRFDDMFNIPDIKIADEIFAPHFTAHRPITPTLNLTHYKSVIQSFYSAFPDFRLEINASIICGDQFVLRLTYHGTHRGDFLGIQATGREISMPGIGIFRVEDGLVVENWEEVDFFGVVQQISSLVYAN